MELQKPLLAYHISCSLKTFNIYKKLQNLWKVNAYGSGSLEI